jgi:hypothetical protein
MVSGHAAVLNREKWTRVRNFDTETTGRLLSDDRISHLRILYAGKELSRCEVQISIELDG